MNLLFLTGKTGGKLFVVNMQIVRSIDLTPSTKYTNVGIEYENESAAEYDVLETPAQIRAQLERMAGITAPSVEKAEPLVDDYGKELKPAFECPSCGHENFGHSNKMLGQCYGCNAYSLYFLRSPHWRIAP